MPFYQLLLGVQIPINHAVVTNEIRSIEPVDKTPTKLLDMSTKDATAQIPPPPMVKPANRARAAGIDNGLDSSIGQFILFF